MNGRVPELDGLRGIAIGMVLVFHYFQLTWITRAGSFGSYLQNAASLAWTGVDLFFVLSGFLIGGILLDARGSPNYFRVFYARRFYRIVPLYAIALLFFPVIVSLARGTHNRFDWLAIGNTIPWYSYWTFTQNFWMAHSERLGAMTLAVTWSLAIEEQFYLTLPFLVRLLPRPQLMNVVRVGIYSAPLLRIGLGLHFRHNWIAPFALMPCRADALLLGVLAAVLLRDDRWKERLQCGNLLTILILALALGMAVLTVVAPTPDNPIMQSFGYTWTALFYMSILLYAVSRPASALSRALRIRWLGWLGGLAYGVYLLHQMVQGMVFGIVWGREPFIDGAYSLLTTLAAVVVTLVIAHLSWRYFELPLVTNARAVYQYERQETPNGPPLRSVPAS